MSADLPNEKMAGGGSAAGALGFPKVKPPVVAGAGAEFTSLLAPPNTKPDGAGEGVTSFFSSGFPKVKVGAAGSLFACSDPNREPACGAGAAELGSPSLGNTEPLAAVVVVVVVVPAVELVSAVDVVSLGVAALSHFS